MTSSPVPPPQPPVGPLPIGSAGPPAERVGHRLKAQSPADLLAVIPYLLGYHPQESLVMAVVRDRTIALSVRIDLVGDPELVADRFRAIAETHDADGVLLVAYSGAPAAADQYLSPAITRLHPLGVMDALYVDGSRWWSRLCTGDCCPADGTPYAIQSNRLAAEAVLAGMTAWEDRAAIERLVQGPDAAAEPVLRERADQLVDEVFALSLNDRRRWTREFVTDYVDRRSSGCTVAVTDDDLLRLACQVVDVLVRDEAWVLISRETAWIHVELWQRVVARAVSPLEPGPLCLLGMAAWVAGQGTLQVCCLERVRAVDSGYTMADLLDDINARAVPPSLWDEIRGGIIAALELEAGTRTEQALQTTGPPWKPREGSRRGRRGVGPPRNRRGGAGH